MKLQIISDLHFEFWDHENKVQDFIKKLKKKGNAEILVIAGDLCSHNFIIHYLESFSKIYEYVVYVSGNHEHYNSSLRKVRELKSQIPNNVFWLDNSVAEIHGQRFIGSTLWFPWQKDNWMHSHMLADFSCIENFKNEVYEENEKSVKYLNENIKENDIVVTHHLPSHECTSDRFKGHFLNRFFVCPMDEVIYNSCPKIWIHGHTHDEKDSILHRTRIVCNPHGYPNERKWAGLPEFDYGKIVEI